MNPSETGDFVPKWSDYSDSPDQRCEHCYYEFDIEDCAVLYYKKEWGTRYHDIIGYAIEHSDPSLAKCPRCGKITQLIE